MSSMTIDANATEVSDVEVLKGFFGTTSGSAAVRASIKLAHVIARASPDGIVVVRDQVSGCDLRVLCRPG